MKKIHLLLAAILLLSLCSCRKERLPSFVTIPLAQSVASDSTSAAWEAIAAFDRTVVRRDIALIGAPVETVNLCEELLVSDSFNNVDGSLRPDGLPDFAGECFQVILDKANTPLADYVKAGKEDYVRDIALRDFIFAMDTVSVDRVYETTRLRRKNRSKVLVLASPYLAAFGKSDIDTLNAFIGRDIPVLSGPHSMVEYLYERLAGTKALSKDAPARPLNIGVWTSKDNIFAGIYSTVMSQEFKAHSDVASTYQVFAPDSSMDATGRFLEFIRMYRNAAPVGKRLSAILVDDPNIDIAEVETFLGKILSSSEDKEEYDMVRRTLDKDFMLVDPARGISFCLYRYLRRANAFTHNIAYPDMEPYVVLASPEVDKSNRSGGDFTREFRLSRSLDSLDPTCVLAVMEDRYFTESFLSFMEQTTPNFFSLYLR